MDDYVDRSVIRACQKGDKMAYAVLQEHAGSQWDPEVIRQLIVVLPTMPTVSTFEEVGRHVAASLRDDNMPSDIGELLATVDAEI